MTNEQRPAPGGANPNRGASADQHYPGNYTFSPVTVTEATGATFLGIIALILLMALLRTLARNRELEIQLTQK
jgi:hypothetical protein